MKLLKSFAIALFALSAITVSAQEQATRKTPQERAAKMSEKMETELGLTADQAVKVAELNLKVAEKVQAIRENQSFSQEKKREFILGNMQDKRRVLETILTADQMVKYDQMIAEKQETAEEE